MGKYRNFVKIIAVSMAALMIRAPVTSTLVTPVHADNSEPEDTASLDLPTFDADQKGSLTLRYFDDSDDTVPVQGAKFRVYQVATIGRSGESNGAYIPLSDDIDFNNSSLTRKDISRSIEADTSKEQPSELDIQEADAYTEQVRNAYQLNPELGQTADITIGADGTGTAADLNPGAYLVQETEPARYHIRSIPFLVSVPEVNEDGTGWKINVTAEPKANVAGDLTVEKILKGNYTESDKQFSFKIIIPESALISSYRCKSPDGTESIVRNGDVIRMKGGQSFTIYDLPEQSDYKIEEIEANENHYTTTYENAEGKIIGKSEQKAVVTNKRDWSDVFTGVTHNPMTWMYLCGAIAALLLLLIATRDKKRAKKG